MSFRAMLRVLLVVVVLGLAGGLRADNWPAWRGANRDGICIETGLLKEWPKAGPKLLWKVRGLGEGYSAPSVVQKRLFVMGNLGGKECVLALDVSKNGARVWSAPIGPVRHNGGGYPGPRSTPTVDIEEGTIYAEGVAGDLVCIDARNGKIVWRTDLVKDLGGQAPQWGYSESVLLDGNWIICTPGGAKNTLAALDKRTGKLVWGCPAGDPAAYSSPIQTSIGLVKQYVTLTGKGLIGVNARGGGLLWRYDKVANGTANIPTPVAFGQTIFGASGYGTGGALVWPQKEADGSFKVQQLYFTRNMKNHHGGVILFDGALYGADDPGSLTCLDHKTGKLLWEDRGPGKCSILFADGMLYCRSERGPISLVAANPKSYQLKGQFEQPDRSDKNAWPHPVISNGRLYIRDQDVLLCYDVREKEDSTKK